MNTFAVAIIALGCLSAVYGDMGAKGVVSPTRRCGGLGTPVQLRISDCDGFCTFSPGKKYDCEMDFFPATAATSLSLRVQICVSSGFCTVVMDVVMPGSSVQPGNLYTARYSIVPNDILSGQRIEFNGIIYHTEGGMEEICVSATAEVAWVKALKA